MKAVWFFICSINYLCGFSQTIDVSLSLDRKMSYPQKMISKTYVNQKVNHQNIITETQVYTDILFKIRKNQNKIYDVQAMYSDVKMDMKTIIDGKTLSFGNMSELISEAIDHLKGNKFDIKLSHKGQFFKTDAIEPVVKKSLDKLVKKYRKNQPLSDIQQKQISEQLIKVFKDETFSNLQSVMAIFPTHRIRKGDSWQVTSSLSNQMNLPIKTTYTLSQVTSESIIIVGKSEVNIENQQVILEQGQQVFFSIQGDIISELKLNRQTRWIQYAQQTQRIKGISRQIERFYDQEKIIPIEAFSEIIIQN